MIPLPVVPLEQAARVIDAFRLALDLSGTFVFALSGAAAGVRHRLDLFGVLVLAFVAANFGGITRDVLIGAIPPAAFTDWRYFAVSLLAGLVSFFWHPLTHRLWKSVLLLDALGLSLFAVVGTQKALAYRLSYFAAPLLGMLTGIGGGMVRDVLVADVPAVFNSEVYALAALAGAIIVVFGQFLNAPPNATAICGAGICFALRLVSIRKKWKLPVATVMDHPEHSIGHQTRSDPESK